MFARVSVHYLTQSLHSQAFFKFGLRNDESHTGQPAPQEWGGCCCRAEQSWRRHTHDFSSAMWTGRSLCACRAAVYAHCCVQAVVLYSLPPIPRSRGLFLLERTVGTYIEVHFQRVQPTSSRFTNEYIVAVYFPLAYRRIPCPNRKRDDLINFECKDF